MKTKKMAGFLEMDRNGVVDTTRDIPLGEEGDEFISLLGTNGVDVINVFGIFCFLGNQYTLNIGKSFII